MNIRIIHTHDDVWEIYDRSYLYGIASTLEEAHRIESELKEQVNSTQR